MAEPLIWVLAGPSGSGKTTLATRLSEQLGLRRARTCTTRSPRPGEINGKDYEFRSEEAFDRMLERGELLECTIYKDHRYGLPAAEIVAGDEVLVVLDAAGVRHLKERFGTRVVAICLAGPTADELTERLRARGSSPPEIAKRLEDLYQEIATLANACDYRILAGSREATLHSALQIIRQGRVHLLALAPPDESS